MLPMPCGGDMCGPLSAPLSDLAGAEMAEAEPGHDLERFIIESLASPDGPLLPLISH